jgi:hypothetical protein
VKNVCEKCNVTITKENISSRSKTFDMHYNIINGLLSTSGFGWDWEKNKLKVDSDTVWDEYVEVRKFSTLYCTLKFSVLLLSGTIIRGTLKTPNSQLVTPISIKLQRPDGCD